MKLHHQAHEPLIVSEEVPPSTCGKCRLGRTRELRERFALSIILPADKTQNPQVSCTALPTKIKEALKQLFG